MAITIEPGRPIFAADLIDALKHANPNTEVWIDHDHTLWELFSITIDDDGAVILG